VVKDFFNFKERLGKIMNKEKIISIFTISILIICIVLCSHQASAYYNWGKIYSNNAGLYGGGYGLGFPGGLYGSMYGLYGSGSIYGSGGSYGLYGAGGLYGLSGLGGFGSNGLNGIYGLQGFGNPYGLYGSGSPYGSYAQGGLFGLNGIGSSGSLYGLGGSYGLNGLGGLYASSGLGGLFGLNSQGGLGNLGQLNSAAFTRSPAVVTGETWVGQWSGVQIIPLSAIPAAPVATTGPMTLRLLEDSVFQTVSGSAVLEFNTFLHGGVELSGTASYALLSLNGIVEIPLVPGGLLNVTFNCIQDTPTHMTGDYKVYDFIAGYYRIYESGTFELELLPTLII